MFFDYSIVYITIPHQKPIIRLETESRSCFIHKKAIEYKKFQFKVATIVGWLVVLRIYVALAIFQPYRDLEAEDNQSLKIQVARPGIEPRSSYSARQELNHSATATNPFWLNILIRIARTLKMTSLAS